MTVDHLYFAWWVDAEGWLWVRHDCNGTVDEWHPPNAQGRSWSLTDDGHVTPSFHCVRCGRHTMLLDVDRVSEPAREAR